MDPRERLLGMGKLYLMRGEPIPLDLLAKADELGLSMVDFGLPTNNETETEEGDIFNVEQEEYDL
jgi:hypothetical protein